MFSDYNMSIRFKTDSIILGAPGNEVKISVDGLRRLHVDSEMTFTDDNTGGVVEVGGGGGGGGGQLQNLQVGGFLDDKTLYHINDTVQITGDFEPGRAYNAVFSSNNGDEHSIAKSVPYGDTQQTILEARIPRGLSAGKYDVFIDTGNLITVGEIELHDRMTPSQPLVVHAMTNSSISFRIPHTTLLKSVADIVNLEVVKVVEGVECVSYIDTKYIHLTMSIPDIQTTLGEIHIALEDSDGYKSIVQITTVLLSGVVNRLVHSNTDITVQYGSKSFTLGAATGNLGTLVDGLSVFPFDVDSYTSTENVTAYLHHDGSVSLRGSGAGMGGLGNSDDPIILPLVPQFSKLFSGRDHFVALARDGSVWVWGDNSKKQCNDSEDISITSPFKIDGTFIDIGVDGDQTFAISSSGVLYGWGDNIRNWSLRSPGDDIIDGFMTVLLPSNVFKIQVTNDSLFSLSRVGDDTIVRSIVRDSQSATLHHTFQNSVDKKFMLDGGETHVIFSCDNDVFSIGTNAVGQCGRGVAGVSPDARLLKFEEGTVIIGIFSHDHFSVIQTNQDTFICGLFNGNVYREPIEIKHVLQNAIANGPVVKNVGGFDVTFNMDKVPNANHLSFPFDSKYGTETQQKITSFATNGRMVAFGLGGRRFLQNGDIGSVVVHDLELNTVQEVTVFRNNNDFKTPTVHTGDGRLNKPSIYITNERMFVTTPSARPSQMSTGVPGVVDYFKRNLNGLWAYEGYFYHDFTTIVGGETDNGYGDSILFDEINEKVFITNPETNIGTGILDEWDLDRGKCIQHRLPIVPRLPPVNETLQTEFRFVGAHVQILPRQNSRLLLTSTPALRKGTIWMSEMQYAPGSGTITETDSWEVIFHATEYQNLMDIDLDNVGVQFCAWESGSKVKVLASTNIQGGYLPQYKTGVQLVYFDYDTITKTTSTPIVVQPPLSLVDSDEFGFVIEHVIGEYVVVSCSKGSSIFVYKSTASGIDFLYEILVGDILETVKCAGGKIFALTGSRQVKCFGLDGSKI